ncbi:Protein kinase-like domain [Phytophthora cactorum]|nr:Protein kinase-like domain [Phytophthora cactorum]
MNRHTGMVLEQNLLNNSVQAFDSGLDEPTHQWCRIPVGGGYFVYKNVATGSVLDHWDIKEGAGNTVAMSDDIRTSGEDSTYVERHWSLIWRQPPCTTREIVTIKNFESDCLLEHSEEIQAVESRTTSANQQWLRILLTRKGTSFTKMSGRRWFFHSASKALKQRLWHRVSCQMGSNYRSRQDDQITSPKDKMRFQREAKLWSQLRHSNIVPFYGANFTTEPFFIVSEFAENGTLNDYLAKGNVGLKAKWQLMHQVAVASATYTAKTLFTGDNIVLSKQGVAMLTDFGFSFLDSGSCSVLAMRDRLGALQWRAPEYIANLAERPTFASDIFSLGMCIIAAVNGAKYPWGNFDSAAVRKCYEERRIPVKRPHCMTEDQWELVGKMVAFEWKVRPKLDDVLEHLANFASTEERSIPVQFANKQKLPLNQQEID